MMTSEKASYKHEFFYILTAVMAVFLMISKFAYLNIALLLLLLIVLLLENNWSLKFPKVIIALCGFFILISIQIIFKPSMYFDQNVAINELFRMVVYILLILVVANLRIRMRTFIYLWYSIFLILLLTAVAQFYKLFGINDLLGDIYGDSIHLFISSYYTDLTLFRAGSVFINFNNYAHFVVMFLCVFLLFIARKGEPVKVTLAVLGVATALLLSGSRTGMVAAGSVAVAAAILLMVHHRLKIKPGNIFRILIFGVSGVVGIILLLNTNIVDLSILRSMDVTTGLRTSLSFKYDRLMDMIQQFNLTNLYIGFGTYDYELESIAKPDFDFGYLFTYYGVSGVLLYLLTLRYILDYRYNHPPQLRMFTQLLIFCLILNSLTGGAFFNLRIFSVYLTLFFVKLIDTERSQE
jgi:hypothetical protein